MPADVQNKLLNENMTNVRDSFDPYYIESAMKFSQTFQAQMKLTS